MRRKNVIIIGAAGRDFHNFNTVFRDNVAYRVVAFTAAQIPDIAGRRYPSALAGRLYPKGIPIYGEADLPPSATDVDVCVSPTATFPTSTFECGRLQAAVPTSFSWGRRTH
jgi:predicted GTPase